MSKRLDVREIPAVDRHAKIHEEFEKLESGEVLELVNDHDPRPLYYEMKEEVPSFNQEEYTVEEKESNKFVAELPKK
ncbi:MAG: DUF2249 domain-containing protein [Halobacteria archaeon]